MAQGYYNEVKNYIDSKGYENIKTKQNEEIPSKEIWKKNGVYVYKSYIPQTYTSSAIVYFVYGTNGDSYGQFPNEEKAIAKAKKMASLSEEERRKFDE
jgi:hypothetical protein